MRVIDSELVTFLVQGAIDNSGNTNRAITSIRKHFPNSKIILSTWVGSNISNLDYDEVVLSKDPGALIINETTGLKFNLNRQIISTQKAIKYITTPYTIKTRTDSLFFNDSILYKYNKYSRRYKINSDEMDRILVISDWYINPKIKYPMAFHCSDFLYFGKTEDISMLFDCELMKKEDAKWFSNNIFPDNHPEEMNNLLFRYAAEQYIMINFLIKKGYVFDFNHAYIINDEIINLSEELIRNYLIVLPSLSIGLYNLKHKWMYLRRWPCYSKKDLRKIYGEKCFFKIFDIERLFLRVILFFAVKLNKFIQNFRF